MNDETLEPGHRERALEAMLAGLRATGLKLTPQRLAIVRELAGDPSHPTANELFERLRRELPTMSFATVYNTLAALAAEGLCQPRALEPGPVRFDPNVTPHDHAVCDGCGLVLDVEHPPRRAPSAPRGGLDGFAIRAVERIYRGLCATCTTSHEADGGSEQATGE